MKKEKDLVKRAKNGDAKALNLLLDNNKSYIYAIAFSLLKNHERRSRAGCTVSLIQGA